MSQGKYKVVECSTVTDEEIERVINNTIDQGYIFEGIQFAMREASKRPAMAFVMFTYKKETSSDGQGR